MFSKHYQDLVQFSLSIMELSNNNYVPTIIYILGQYRIKQVI